MLEKFYINNIIPAVGLAEEPELARAEAIPSAAPAYTRKNQASTTADEQRRFKAAITKLIETGFYDKHVAVHANMNHQMHTMMGGIGSQRFLPWHRDYLLKLEQEMRKIDPKIAIPYWNWTEVREIPGWMADFLPTGVKLPNGQPIPVTRTPGQDAPDLPTRDQIDQIMERANFTSFTLALEGARPFGGHNQVHVWVGGTMGTMLSPADPLFWMHHAEIDRRWYLWQMSNP